jgi:hypothetical protein
MIKLYLDGFIPLILRKNIHMTSIGFLIFTFDSRDEESNIENKALFSYLRIGKKYSINLFWFINFKGEIK